MSGRRGQCCAEMPVHNGVAYCIKPKGHDGMHRTAEITFGDYAVGAADEIERLRAENEMLRSFRDMVRKEVGRVASLMEIPKP